MAGDGQVNFQIRFKFPLKKYRARTWRLKKKSCRAGKIIKKISSSLKILQPPHQKSNGPPLKRSLMACAGQRDWWFIQRNEYRYRDQGGKGILNCLKKLKFSMVKKNACTNKLTKLPYRGYLRKGMHIGIHRFKNTSIHTFRTFFFGRLIFGHFFLITDEFRTKISNTSMKHC